MQWVGESNVPLLKVDNELTRSTSRWNSVSSPVLHNSIQLAAKKFGTNLEVLFCNHVIQESMST
jgi:hypothetical protein